MCIAVGMWFSLKNEVFPHLALPAEHVQQLEMSILDPQSSIVRQELLEVFEKCFGSMLRILLQSQWLRIPVY